MTSSPSHGREIRQSTIAGVRRAFVVLEIDAEGVVRNANERALEVLGYARHEVVGRPHGMLAPTPSEGEALTIRLARGEVVEGDFERVGKGGRPVWLRGVYYPVVDAAGPSGATFIASDQTAEVMAARRVRARLDAFARHGVVDGAIEGRWAPEGEALRLATNGALATLAEALAAVEGIARAVQKGELTERTGAERFGGQLRNTLEAVDAAVETAAAAVGEACLVADQVAAGDLRQRIRGPLQGDFALLKVAFNRVAEELDGLLLQARRAGREVAKASAQVERTGSSLQDGERRRHATASSSHALSTTRQHARAHGTQVSEAHALVERSLAALADGRDRLGDMAAPLAALRDASDQIAPLVKVVDEVAFRTKLLALEATVAAAKAGEHGRGFIAVARELRRLARQTAEVTRAMDTITRSSRSHASEGESLQRATSEGLAEVIDQVHRVRTLVDEVGATGRTQEAGLSRLEEAVGVLAADTSGTTTRGAELTAAAETIGAHARDLLGALDRLRLSEAPPAHPDALSPEMVDHLLDLLEAQNVDVGDRTAPAPASAPPPSAPPTTQRTPGSDDVQSQRPLFAMPKDDLLDD